MLQEVLRPGHQGTCLNKSLALKKLLPVVSVACTLIAIYILLGHSPINNMQEQGAAAPQSYGTSSSAAQNSTEQNPFQKKLDEQKHKPSSLGVQHSSEINSVVRDPFKAFLLEQEKQRLEQARISPFGK